MKTFEVSYFQNGIYITETVQGHTRIEAQGVIIHREKRHIIFEEVKEVAHA